MPRRAFAAKFAHRGAGITWAVIGGLFLLSGASAIGSETESSPGTSIFIGFALVALSVFLLRGRGENPRIAERRAAALQRQTANAASGMEQATAALRDARRGGERLVAFRNLEATAQQFYPQEVRARVDGALASIGFDLALVSSPRFGLVAARDGGAVEVFRDWIVYGQTAHDVEAATRGNVYLDGAIQVSSAVNQKGRVVKQTHDMRTAELQFTSSTWSLRVPIRADDANGARQLVDQLAIRVDEMKPQGATTADIKSMVDTILNNTGQPPAEKLTQLSNLRFDRLLTDEQFELAKAKILGIH